MSQFKIYEPNYEQVVYWVTERENIRRNKEAGKAPPWTKDPRMAATRWCNVRRMDDKVSRWLLDHFYTNRHIVPSEMAVGASLARMINRPETLSLLCPEGYSRFNYRRFCAVLARMHANKEQIFTGVYIINGANANGRKKWQLVLDNLHDMWNSISDEEIDTGSMEQTHKNLMRYSGLGSFIAGQVVADLRHVIPGTWADRNSWAPQGPGSSRGLAYVFGLRKVGDPESKETKITPKLWGELFPVYCGALRSDPRLKSIFKDRKLEAHDLQSTLCESSKFFRLLGGGRSKNKYTPLDARQLSLI